MSACPQRCLARALISAGVSALVGVALHRAQPDQSANGLSGDPQVSCWGSAAVVPGSSHETGTWDVDGQERMTAVAQGCFDPAELISYDDFRFLFGLDSGMAWRM
jgi:hypothetical protein